MNSMPLTLSDGVKPLKLYALPDRRAPSRFEHTDTEISDQRLETPEEVDDDGVLSIVKDSYNVDCVVQRSFCLPERKKPLTMSGRCLCTEHKVSINYSLLVFS